MNFFAANSKYFSEDPENLINYLNEAGFNGNTLVSLFYSKIESINLLYNDYPDLKTLSYEELNELVMHCNSVILGGNREESCASSYTADISDCDASFTVGTLFSVLAAAGATVVGTPIAGAGALSLGMGATYMNDKICRSTAARHYRECMGYE